MENFNSNHVSVRSYFFLFKPYFNILDLYLFKYNNKIFLQNSIFVNSITNLTYNIYILNNTNLYFCLNYVNFISFFKKSFFFLFFSLFRTIILEKTSANIYSLLNLKLKNFFDFNLNFNKNIFYNFYFYLLKRLKFSKIRKKYFKKIILKRSLIIFRKKLKKAQKRRKKINLFSRRFKHKRSLKKFIFRFFIKKKYLIKHANKFNFLENTFMASIFNRFLRRFFVSKLFENKNIKKNFFKITLHNNKNVFLLNNFFYIYTDEEEINYLNNFINIINKNIFGENNLEILQNSYFYNKNTTFYTRKKIKSIKYKKKFFKKIKLFLFKINLFKINVKINLFNIVNLNFLNLLFLKNILRTKIFKKIKSKILLLILLNSNKRRKKFKHHNFIKKIKRSNIKFSNKKLYILKLKLKVFLIKNFTKFSKNYSKINFFNNLLNFRNFIFFNLKPFLINRWRFLSKLIESGKNKFKNLFNFDCTNLPVIDFLHVKVKQKFVNFFSSTGYFDVSKYIYQYLINFFEFFLLKKITILLVTNNSERKIFFSEDEISDSLKIFYPFQSKIGKGLFLSEMVELLFLTFLKKDLNIFKNWFIATMEKIFFKKHRKLLFLIKFMFYKFLWKYFLIFGCKGFKLSMSGKIGVAGNSKTRTVIINWGKSSLTNKSHKLEYLQDIVRTTTGALGLTLMLTY